MLLSPVFFAWLQVQGVPLDLLDDVFLLHFALKATQCILEGFAFLESHFRQLNHTPQTSPFWTG
jgi:hypothetical protein